MPSDSVDATDALVVVVEPGQRSLQTAARIRRLAEDIGLKRVLLVGNKVRGDDDRTFFEQNMPEFTFLGFVPRSEAIADADLAGAGLTLDDQGTASAISLIADRLCEVMQQEL